MTRIAVIGNCQAITVSEVIKFFRKEAFVKTFITWEIPKWYQSSSALIEDLQTFDLIFSQDGNFSPFIEGGFSGLKTLFPDAIQFPIIVFPAYHPDLIYINIINSKQVGFFSSPIGAYNSAISLLGYKMGLSPFETLSLFNERIYDRLGYFDLWNSSQKELLDGARTIDFPLDQNFVQWTRSGCFMHSINHCKIRPLSDIAKILLQKANLRFHDDDWVPFIVDPSLSDAVWPVYPEIADRLSIKGSSTFRRPDYMSKDTKKYFSLESFVLGSFEGFGFMPRNSLSSNRVDEWIKNENIKEFILSSF